MILSVVDFKVWINNKSNIKVSSKNPIQLVIQFKNKF